MVRHDAIEALIDITYKQALDEENLQPLERGEVEDINVADDQTLVYTVLVSVRPEVTLPDYNEITITHEKTVVTEETVDNEIERGA